MIEEKFFVYIIQSKDDLTFYVVQCDDLDKRMSKHIDGFSKYTSSKSMWRLRYFEVYSTRSEAILRERQIKKMKSRKYLQSLVDNWQIE